MKKIFICCLFSFILNTSIQAQVLPIYFRRGAQTMNKALADSYGVTGKISTADLYTLKIYSLYNELMQTGTYKDQELTIPQGIFTFYADVAYFNDRYGYTFSIKDRPRFVSEIGNYVNGVEEGKWLIFYPNGDIMNEQNYKGGVLNGMFITYAKNGKVLIKGNYVDGKKNGDWLFDGKRTETYIMDELVKKGTATKVN